MTAAAIALATLTVTLTLAPTTILACAILQRAEIEDRDDAADREGVCVSHNGASA